MYVRCFTFSLKYLQRPKEQRIYANPTNVHLEGGVENLRGGSTQEFSM